MEKVIAYILLPMLLLGCQKNNDCFSPHGDETTQSRAINEGFHSVEIHDYIDVFLVPQKEQSSLVLKGGKNLIQSISTSIEDSLLIIRHDINCKWSRNYDQRYSIYVPLTNFKRLKYYGSGNVYATDTLVGDTTIIDSWNGTGSFHLITKTNKIILGINSGTVDINISGKTNKLYIWQQGLGVIKADELYSPYGWIDHGATGHCFISNQFDHLDLLQYGIGNIYYGGTPSVNFIQKDGPGKFIHR